MRTTLGILGSLLIVAVAVVHLAGSGSFGRLWGAGQPTPAARPQAVEKSHRDAQIRAAGRLGVAAPKRILFGDLHVHTTHSVDAFAIALPLNGGDGPHPVSDACDFARFCSALDFWSVNDHAITLTPGKWRNTIDEIRQCNAVSGQGDEPDVVAYLGWEWTQAGGDASDHFGHKNVILRGLADEEIPARPIAARRGPGLPPATAGRPNTLALGLMALSDVGGGGLDLATYVNDLVGYEQCAKGVPVRDLPPDCMESAETPEELFEKLNDWGVASIVIPHGTTWGMYTPQGSSWDKQLRPGRHDPRLQNLIEIYSGHGNSEEFRTFREVVFKDDGSVDCPEPSPDYLPSCWRAGEIIRERCIAAGESEELCDERAAEARGLYATRLLNSSRLAVPGSRPEDWLDSGQCRDCFQPSFNYRPRSSVQYILALNEADNPTGVRRFRFGFIASSDNHSARPGTGYKEVARTEMTEARFARVQMGPLGRDRRRPEPTARAFDPRETPAIPFVMWEWERAGSFFLTGGLVAVHADGGDREAIWEALRRREVYGTSGPRILLWFNLLGFDGGDGVVPMGGEIRTAAVPRFEAKAVGSFVQKPGCPDFVGASLGREKIERLCRGECYNPSDLRRRIDRIEVVRIRPRQAKEESTESLIDDPWRTFACEDDGSGCAVTFSDEEFPGSGRDALYYVRAIEEPSPVIGAQPLTCKRDESGRCIELVDSCSTRPDSDDCLSPSEQRAWSSPIFVDYRAE